MGHCNVGNVFTSSDILRAVRTRAKEEAPRLAPEGGEEAAH